MIYIFMEYILQTHCKELIKETKKEIAFVENPNGLYDLVYDEIIADADTETARKKDE